MGAIMLAIDVGIPEVLEFSRQLPAQFHRHHLILRSMNDVSRRRAKVLQKRKQDVIDPAGHRRKSGKQGRMMHADQPGTDTAVGHAAQEDAVGIDPIPLLRGLHGRQHQIFRASGEPGSGWIGRTGQDVALAQA